MFFRFLIVGGTGFLIDAGTTHALVMLLVPPWIARIPALVIAMTYTWLANRHFTYRTSKPRTTREASRYALVAITMACVNYGLYCGLVALGIIPVAAVALATAAQTIASFYAYRRFVFGSAV